MIKKQKKKATTTLTNERLNFKNCGKYEKQNIVIFFLESTFFHNGTSSKT